MEQYTWHEAQGQLLQLLHRVQQGEDVQIIDDNQQVVLLVPILQPSPTVRRAGSAKGQIQIAADFDAPLADFESYQ